MRLKLPIIIITAALTVSACHGPNLSIDLGKTAVILKQPIELDDVYYFKDGGTTTMVLKDRAGQIFKVGFPSTFGSLHEDMPPQLFFGADHPSRPGSESIPVAGKEEKSVLSVLELWRDAHVTADEQAFLESRKNMEGLSKKQVDIRRALWMIKAIEFRNKAGK